MNLAKKLIAVFLIVAMIFCFAACGGNDEAENALDIGTINIGFIATGDVEDDPYSALHYNQFQSAYKLAGAGDSQVTLEENVKAGDVDAMETAIADLVARGCRLIVGIDRTYCDEFVRYAEENKNIFFAVPGDVSNEDSVADNLAILSINNFEAEYLEGIAAALSSKSGRIGYVSDTTFGATVNADVNAFTKGAQSVKANAEIFFIGTSDIKAGVDMVLEKKCDVIYSRNFVADEETGETFFQVPGSVGDVMTVNKITKNGNEFVSGASLNVEFLYTKVVLNTVNETFGDLAKFTWGIKDGVIDVYPAADESVKTAVDKARDEFMAGKNPAGTGAELSGNFIKGITVL